MPSEYIIWIVLSIKGDFFKVIYLEDRQKVMDCINEVINSSNLSVVECRTLTRSKKVHWIRLVASAAVRKENYILVYCSYTSMKYEIEARNELEKNIYQSKYIYQNKNVYLF